MIFLSSALYIELSARYGFEILRTPNIEVGAIVSGCRDTIFREVFMPFLRKGGVNIGLDFIWLIWFKSWGRGYKVR